MTLVTATAVSALSFRDLTEKQQETPLYDWLKSLAEPLRLRVRRAADFTGIIPARYGDIYAYSPTKLAWCAVGMTTAHTRTAALSSLTCPYEIAQWGDVEFTIIFAPEDLDQVATVAHCGRRKVISAEARERLLKQLQDPRCRRGENTPRIDLNEQGATTPLPG